MDRGEAVIEREDAPSPPAAAGEPTVPAADPRANWLQAISSTNNRVLTRVAGALAYLLLALMILLELRVAERIPSIPYYYLLPIWLLAWFRGWRSALWAAGAAFLLPLVRLVWSGAPVSRLPTIHLARLLTLIVGVLIARAVNTASRMLQFVHRGAAHRASQRPRRIGARLLVVPLLDTEDRRELADLGPGLVPIYLHPGMAFGSASHPTTQMCLQLLEGCLQSGASVLDVGTGTGILALAAAKLGAARVHAIDHNPAALQVARKNLAANGVEDKVSVQLGSLEDLEPQHPQRATDGLRGSSQSRPPAAGSQYDLIVANVLTGVVQELIETQLGRLLAREGVLIASGIRSGELEMIEAALLEQGLQVDQSLQEAGWCALAARRQ